MDKKPSSTPLPWSIWAAIVIALILGTFKLGDGSSSVAKAEAAAESSRIAYAQSLDNTRDIQRARANLGLQGYDRYDEAYDTSYGQSASAVGGLNNYDDIERIRNGASRGNDDADYHNRIEADDNAAAAIGKLTYSYIPWGGLIVVLFFICFGSLLYLLLSKQR